MDKCTTTCYLKDAFVLLFYRIFSFIPISKKIRKEHLNRNNEAWELYKIRFPKDTYIEHQSALSDFAYGSRYGADYNSCEVIALYNAIVALGEKRDFPDLLECFERKGITWLGAFGTSPFALIKYIKSMGHSTHCFTYNKWQYICSDNEFINKCDSYIFMSYNNSHTIRDMIHTMCVTKEGEHYQTHNDYEGAKCYNSLSDAVNGYKEGYSRMILIIGIRKI